MSIVRDLTFFRVDGFSFILSKGLAGTVLFSKKVDTVQDIFQTILSAFDLRPSTFCVPKMLEARECEPSRVRAMTKIISSCFNERDFGT